MNSHVHPYFHRKHTPHPVPPEHKFPPTPAGAWTIPTLWERYRLPTDLVGNGVIGIFEAGGGWVESDVAANFEMMKLPAPRITDVSVDGSQNNRNPSDPASTEVMLDIVGAAGAFSKATGKAAEIRIYYSQSFSEAISMAAKDGCRVLSFSWGASQPTWGSGLSETLEDVDAAAEAAVKMGMVLTAAAGDNDADDGGGAAAVDGPACCLNFIGCGGTRLTATAETVWNNTPGNPSGEGTGGGYADNTGGNFPLPPWMLGVVPPPVSTMGRMVPDVSAVADPETGIYMIVGEKAGVVGGTSFVAPFYAGLIAAAARGPLPLLTPLFWANPGVFNYAISGDNGVYHQPPFPGPCTGLGSPRGTLAALITSAKL